MKILLYSVLTVFILSAKGQGPPDPLRYPGEYVNGIKASESLSLTKKAVLKLNCDSTFLIEDSSYNSFGTWATRKTNLILHTDSVRFEGKIALSNLKTVFNIKEGKFYLVPISRHVYKKTYKEMQSCFPKPAFSKLYKSMLKQIEGKYLIRKQTYNCD